jgi:REP element-mobilizing transposase RayT
MPNYDWDVNEYPLAYFITIRTHGTWLHGDERGSVERHDRNLYGADGIGLDPVFSVVMGRNMEAEAFLLDGTQRRVVDKAIRSVCTIRGYGLKALNVRTNHAHIVVTAPVKPNAVMVAFKANATRELKEALLVGPDQKVWSRGGSTKYLWKPQNVERAIEYTINGQGEDLPDF